MAKNSVRFLFRTGVALVVALVLTAGNATLVKTQANHDVVILVVDDFTGGDLDADGAGTDDSCAVSFEEQAFAVRGASTGDSSALTHGELVLAQLEELLEQAGVDTVISLVPVDIHAMTADGVVDAIVDSMAANPADVYVANMSFALIPCDYVAAYNALQADLMEARETQNSRQYRSLLQRAVVFYDGTVFPAMSQRAQRLVNLNPLQDLFVEQGARLVPVAAAGNYGLNFPFWPGAWSQAISVSASVGQGYYPASAWVRSDDSPLLGAVAGQRGQNSRFSNYGEVMLPGEYESEIGPLLGTSFAAPRLTVVLALYALDAGLGYCQTADGNPALAYGDWDNLSLTEVARQYCSGVEAYLPLAE